VTTPPSKGLVVELYLIYFGLAQSFANSTSVVRHGLIQNAANFGLVSATALQLQMSQIKHLQRTGPRNDAPLGILLLRGYTWAWSI
jgi:hypothetical protein